MGFDDSTADKYIKRLWTTVKCDNVEPGDEKLSLWHLSAEKKYAFEKMFFFLQKGITESQYVNYLSKLLYIPENKNLRKLKKVLIKIREKI